MAKRMTQKLDEKFGMYPHTISYFLKVAFSQEGTEQKLKRKIFSENTCLGNNSVLHRN